MNQQLRGIILWRDPRISGALFIFGLLVLIALSFYSVIVVFTCITIPTLVVTIVLRCLFAAKSAIFKQSNDHPFQYWLEEKWEVRGEKMDSMNRRAAYYANTIVLHAKKIIFVEDFLESLKGLVFLYMWYYIGKNISAITLMFLGYFGLFTIPKVYDMYRKHIDCALKQIHLKYEECYQRIIDNVPGISERMKKKKKEKNSKKEKEEEKND